MRDAHGAAQLLQAPLADWFLELEHCKADGGVLELLRVDTAQARVHVQASLPDDAMVSGWLTCLNAGLPVPAWRMQRIAAADRPPVPGGLPGWTVVLERSATGPADSKQ